MGRVKVLAAEVETALRPCRLCGETVTTLSTDGPEVCGGCAMGVCRFCGDNSPMVHFRPREHAQSCKREMYGGDFGYAIHVEACFQDTIRRHDEIIARLKTNPSDPWRDTPEKRAEFWRRHYDHLGHRYKKSRRDRWHRPRAGARREAEAP